MSTSLIDQILTAVVAALSTSPPITGLTVSRERTLPLTKASCPAMIVYAMHDHQLERPGNEESPVSDRQLHFAVECRQTGEPIDVQLDSLMNWAVKALNIDPRFGGLVAGLQLEDMQWAFEDADEVYGGVRLDFTAHYSVLAADFTANPG